MKTKIVGLGILISVMVICCITILEEKPMVTTTTIPQSSVIDAYDKYMDCQWFCYLNQELDDEWTRFLLEHGVKQSGCLSDCGDSMVKCYSHCYSVSRCSDDLIHLCSKIYNMCKLRCAIEDGVDNLHGVDFNHWLSQPKKNYSEMVDDCLLAEDNYVAGYMLCPTTYWMFGFDTWNSIESQIEGHGQDVYISEYKSLDGNSVPNIWWIEPLEDVYVTVNLGNYSDNIEIICYSYPEKKTIKVHFKGCLLSSIKNN